jgi:predicted secreted protein
MSYTNSKAFAGRGSALQYSTNPPSVAYAILQEVKNFQFSGSKADLADVTNYESGNFREWLPTLNDSGEATFSGNLIPNDSTEQDIIGFFNNQTLVTWQLVLPASTAYPTSLGTFTFSAYVTSTDRAVPHDKEATISVKLKITGKVVFTAGS